MKKVITLLASLTLLFGSVSLGVSDIAFVHADGNIWTQTSQGMYGGDITALALSPSYGTDRIVYAGLSTGGVFKSSDGGITWSAVNNGLTGLLLVEALAISHNYANGGASWSDTGPGNLIVNALAISPNYLNNQTVFAGIQNGGVYKTTNGGMSWTFSGLATSDPETIAISPGYANDQTIFAGTDDDGVFKSTNRGASWSYVGLSEDVFALAISPDYPSDQTVYAGRGNGVYKSRDGGSSWSAMNAGLEAWITSLVLTSTDPRILFAGPTFYYGIWKYSIEAPQHRTFLPVIMKGVQW